MEKTEKEMTEAVLEALKNMKNLPIENHYDYDDDCEQVKIDDDDNYETITLEIPFGIRMKCTQYAETEIELWLDGGGDSYTKEEWEVYEPFLKNFLMGKLKPSTMVNAFALIIFQDDVDNRASIDYREGHHDDQLEIYNGGKYFDQKSKKLKAHLHKHNLLTKGEIQ